MRRKVTKKATVRNEAGSLGIAKVLADCMELEMVFSARCIR